MSNPRGKWSTGGPRLARGVIGTLGTRGAVVWLVDKTSWPQKLTVRTVSLAERRRALPRARWWSPNDRHPLPQVPLFGRLSDGIAPAIPTGLADVVAAERGIGHSPARWRARARRGWYDLVRGPGGLPRRRQDGPTVALRELSTRRGPQWCGAGRAFQKAGRREVWAIGRWLPPCRAPWWLLSNGPQAHGAHDGWRMWEALAFRAGTSGGGHWQRRRGTAPAHVKRLGLGLALAEAWVVSLGTRVVRERSWRRQFTRGQRWQWSVFQLGLRLLRHGTELGWSLPYELLLIPHLPVL